MAMDKVLKQLESKIDELIEVYGAARSRVDELEQRVTELEGRLSGLLEADERVRVLEQQRDALADRLHQVVATIDQALGSEAVDAPEG
jgi:uncharacterized protein involved in exopolysaccharide biosynthesis